MHSLRGDIFPLLLFDPERSHARLVGLTTNDVPLHSILAIKDGNVPCYASTVAQTALLTSVGVSL